MSSGMKQRGGKSSQKKEKAAEPAVDSGTKARYQKMIEAVAVKAPPSVQPYIVKVAPFIAEVVVAVQCGLPYIVQGIMVASDFIARLPDKVLHAGIGFLICFFGGIFPATIAAYEAWSLCGGTEAIRSVKELYTEACKVRDASKEDDKTDDDNDGISDVDQISGQNLVTRKVLLTMKVVDPNTFNGAVARIWTGWVGVLAVLKVQFAKTVTLGEVIGEKMYEPAKMYVEPELKAMVPEEYKQWVPMVLKWLCKAVAISMAWWTQRVVSALHSAIRGGLMCGKHVVNFLHEKGYIKASDEHTYLDEAVGWGLAVAGLIFQFSMGFRAPFPLNILLLPVSMTEWVIVWSVTSR